MSELWKYFPLRTCPTSPSGFCNILQACLADRAWLKQIRSRNPIPPHSLQNAKIANYSTSTFFFVVDPHQKPQMT
ncbi:hypothetical protein Scep_030130 [Stephania cephalantha]|uniref:Uncharacterized protein n=1 Tax=Stephania cephalantha TaxID=152367 RepID=A0AAP0DYZ4_9MAGN